MRFSTLSADLCFFPGLRRNFFFRRFDFFVNPAANLSNDGGKVNGGKVGIDIVGRLIVGRLIVENVGKVGKIKVGAGETAFLM